MNECSVVIATDIVYLISYGYVNKYQKSRGKRCLYNLNPCDINPDIASEIARDNKLEYT